MSLKPPFTGTGQEQDAADLPLGDNNRDSLDGVATSWPTRPTRSTKSTRPIKPPDRASQAINDAQEGLSALLKPQSDKRDTQDSQPHIISPSGATRNHSRGRVAGPTATPVTRPHDTSHLAGFLTSGSSSDTSALSTVVEAYEDSGEIHAVPQTRLGIGVAKGKEQIEVIRQRASLLIAPGDGISTSPAETAAIQGSRRAAARWATRYATHIVIVLIVGFMVVVGGLSGFTQGGYSGSAADADLGTDHIEAEHDVAGGKPDLDSNDFDLTLPRTELSGGVVSAPNTGGEIPSDANSATVTKYTVAKGDTIQSVAAAFHVMPETIMGSNGIFDPDQDLTAGESLNIPPVDGMYYVPAEGDTLETIAHRYGVDPEVISSYAPNKVAAGGIKAGQAVVVPGGMMPAREVVLIYTVNPGDTLRGIAARFGVDVPTMINSNDIPDPDSLQIGSELRVLPVAGLEYKVRKGDTVRSIADRLGVSPQMIMDYTPNGISADAVLQIDQTLIVPGGRPERVPAVAVRPQTGTTAAKVTKPATGAGGSKPAASTKVKPKVEAQSKPAAKKPAATKPAASKPVAKPASNTPKVGTGRMMWPVQGRITQYYSSRHNGLDIAVAAGTPIHAADSGRIIWSGWRTDGLGNCVMIDHGNGLITIYGHMIRKPPVYVGQYVSKGDIIGNIGSTGRSTGPHVHFMVKQGTGRNYRNPLAYLSSR
jgi:murein DD-endopeptidase MepM/ murein hydrolase activator NlpD